MTDLKFIVEIKDYESGTEDEQIDTADIEEVVRDLLGADASDGTVIVAEA